MKYFSPHQTKSNKSKDQESQGNLSRNTALQMKKQNPTKHADLDVINVDHVSSNVRPYRFRAMLYDFEDNEAVIKMIIKRRSPTMRLVSRTHTERSATPRMAEQRREVDGVRRVALREQVPALKVTAEMAGWLSNRPRTLAEILLRFAPSSQDIFVHHEHWSDNWWRRSWVVGGSRARSTPQHCGHDGESYDQLDILNCATAGQIARVLMMERPFMRGQRSPDFELSWSRTLVRLGG